MEKIPGYLGFLILTEDGSVINSGGELENDEITAKTIFNMVSSVNKDNLLPNGMNASFHRIMVQFQNHVYVVALSNKKLHIVKKKYSSMEPVNV